MDNKKIFKYIKTPCGQSKYIELQSNKSLLGKFIKNIILIIDDEKILKRANSVTAAYDDFINDAHEWDQGRMWEKDWKDSPSGAFAKGPLETSDTSQQHKGFAQNAVGTIHLRRGQLLLQLPGLQRDLFLRSDD